MPILVLILIALAAGTLAGLVADRYPAGSRRAAPPTAAETARAVGGTVRRHPKLRDLLERRLNPESATGLALSLALVFTIGAGVLLGLLAYLVRTSGTLARLDHSVGVWGQAHATALSTHGLNAVTQLGSIYVVVALAVVLALVELRRAPNRWIVPFLLAILGGEEIVANLIKQIVDRTRPAFNPAAASLGPSFPSGHTTTAAAFYAGAALLIGRRRPPIARAALTGTAVGIAVAVASSRVLLDLHWLSDVIGGLALGWAWFAICAVAFGGRFLRFGVAAEIAARVADGGAASPAGRRVGVGS